MQETYSKPWRKKAWLKKNKMTETQLIATIMNSAWITIVLSFKISVLIFCGGVFWCFLPKKTDDPIIKAVKTCGIMGGLLISLIIFIIMSK